MKKLVVFIFLSILAKSLFCQNSKEKNDLKVLFQKEFVTYFVPVELPFSTYKELYVDFHNFDIPTIKKYISSNDQYLIDWSGYTKEIASFVRFSLSKNIYVVIIDETTECGTYRKLVSYDSVGNYLSTIDFFASKSFHGHRNPDEIEYYEIESILNKDFSIYSQYFEIYPNPPDLEETSFKGRYIEYKYQIHPNGVIEMTEKIDHGIKKYKSGIFEDREIPRWDLAE
jgi:hypothetical protein